MAAAPAAMAKEGLGHYQSRGHQAYSMLILEDFPLISEHMHEMGHIVKTYSPRWLLSGSSSALPEITAGKYDLVWCSALPGSSRDVTSSRSLEGWRASFAEQTPVTSRLFCQEHEIDSTTMR